MIAEIEKPKFSLMEIESALAELLTARAEAEEITDPVEKDQALNAVDTALMEYVAREVQKADSIIGFCRTLRRAADAAKEDATYYARRANFLERTLVRVKDITQYAMEACGRKRIDGRHGYLLLRGNGGLEPLSIDESMLPDEYRDVTVRMSRKLWNEISLMRQRGGNCYRIPGIEVLSDEPANGRIREALKLEPIPGAHLEPRGSSVLIK